MTTAMITRDNYPALYALACDCDRHREDVSTNDHSPPEAFLYDRRTGNDHVARLEVVAQGLQSDVRRAMVRASGGLYEELTQRIGASGDLVDLDVFLADIFE